MKKIDDWREIQIGKHGVEIKKNGRSDGRSGVFLPLRLCPSFMDNGQSNIISL